MPMLRRKPLAPGYVRSKSAANSMPIRGLHKLLPHASLSPRFDPVFSDGLSWAYLRANWEAFTALRDFRPERVAHVGVIADSRGGSHLVHTQFHYLRCAFCFGESFSPTSTKALNYRSFLVRGVFGVNSLQDKTPAKFTHLFYLLNNDSFPASRVWLPETATPFRRYWLFVFRNPLRTLISMHRTAKSKWRLSPVFVAEFLRAFKERLALSAAMEVDMPERVKSILYEQLVQNPDRVFAGCCSFLGIDPALVEGRSSPRDFFRRFLRCESRPIDRGGFLVSAVSGEKILGIGGAFNPIASIDPERAFSPSIADTFPPDLLDIAVQELGSALFELFRDDEGHQFRRVGIRELQAACGS